MQPISIDTCEICGEGMAGGRERLDEIQSCAVWFNQAELIARAALKRLAMSGIELAADLLVRQRITVSQIGPTRPQRAENIRGAFRVEHPEKIAGRCVLLVDDVLTTGTTASECARVLGKASAEKVWVATVARTLKQTGQNFAAEPDFEIAARAS